MVTAGRVIIVLAFICVARTAAVTEIPGRTTPTTTPVTNVYPESKRCEDGWIWMGSINSISDIDGLCLQVNKEAKTWRDAEKHCGQQISNLMYLDRFNQYFTRTVSQDLKYPGDMLVDERILDWWSGMYVRNDRLYWDLDGPRYVRQGSQYGWKFGHLQPNPAKGNCGRATTLEILIDSAVLRYSGSLNVSLDDCNRKLPYVCHKPPIPPSTQNVSYCPNGWYGNQYLPRCYKIFLDSLPYNGAYSACQEVGGNLAQAGTQFTGSFLRYLVNLYREMEVAKFGAALWIDNGASKTSDCQAYDAINYYVRSQLCNTSSAYVCTVPTQYKGSGSFEIVTSLTNQTRLQQLPAFQPQLLMGMLGRALLEGETVFLHTPTTILNSTSFYNQYWENMFSLSSQARYDVTSSSNTASPYYVNVTLPSLSGGETRKKRQTLTDGFVRQVLPVNSFIPDYNSLGSSVGEYSFTLYNVNPPMTIETPPVFVRYSERDLFVYVAHFVVRQEGEVFTSSDAHLSNLIKLEPPNLGEYMSALGGIRQTYPSFRLIFDSVDVPTNLVRYRLFVSPTNARYAPGEPEQTVFKTLQTEVSRRLSNYPTIIDISTIQVLSTVTCPEMKVERNGQNLTFPATAFGQRAFSWERCYPENKARAYVLCDQGGYDVGVSWGNIFMTAGCGPVPNLNQSSSTSDLKNLSETEFDNTNFNNILNNTRNLTAPDVNLTEADIIYTADILYNYIQSGIPQTPEALGVIYEILNNVLNANKQAVESAQKITNAANRIVRSVDDLTFLLGSSLGFNGTGAKTFYQDFVAGQVLVQRGSESSLVIGLSLGNLTSDVIDPRLLSDVNSPDDVTPEEIDTAIYLDIDLLKAGATRLALQVYSQTSLFTVISSRFKINSKVAAARLNQDGEDVVNLNGEQLTAVFELNEADNLAVCAYWDYTANQDGGGWRTDGCSTRVLDDGKTVVCKCNHLTNFAVLIDLNAHKITDTDKLILGIITKIGLILSIIGLGITILTFLIFKHLRKGRGQQVLVNLSVAMLCSAVIFLVGIEQTSSRGGCITVAVLLHYFVLVAFMWMLVEGILQYLRFVKVLGTYIPHFMIKSMIPAWGVPLIPVIVVLAIDYNYYYSGKGYCWLQQQPMLYAFLIPVAVIILANLIVFILVMWNLCKRRNKGMTSNQSDRKMAMLHLQAAVSVFVVLGLTWIFGFLAVEDARIVFHYLFAILNAFQGFFIFILFTFREKQIRKAWRKLCCRSKVYKSTTSSDTHAHKHVHSNSDTKSTGMDHSSSSDKARNKNGNRNGSESAPYFRNPQFNTDA